MWIYIMASARNGTLYVGVTNSLARRVTEHREGRGSDFVRKYKVARLVYAEAYARADEAIAQEKRIKHWARAYKIALIEKSNPNWDDLYETIHLGLTSRPIPALRGSRVGAASPLARDDVAGS